MCGRYSVSTEEEVIEIREIIHEINQKLANTPEAAMMKMGEIFPTDIAPVLTAEDGVRQARLMKWGFPMWKGSGVVINARQETAAQKSMFRAPLLNKRCVIPSTGFFEWTHGAGQKQKYLLKLPEEPALYMAGIFNVFRDQQKMYAAYTILTTAANESVCALHDRMPVILQKFELDAWLLDGAVTQEFLGRTGPELALEKVG